MAKLKFDRSINLKLEKDNSVTVPNDEVWKGFLVCATGGWDYNSRSDLNGIELKQGGTNTENGNLGLVILGGGAKLSYLLTFTGVVFKVIS